MKWVKATEETFKNEDWQFRHYRYLSGYKLDTDLFEVVPGGLRKIGGTGFLPEEEIEVLDESITESQVDGLNSLIEFAKWYSGMEEEKVKRAIKRWVEETGGTQAIKQTFSPTTGSK